MFHWMAVYPVTCALLLVVLFCLLQSWLLKKDFFSPVTVYCFSQCITLAIAYLQIDAFMSDFKPLTWMVWILGLVAFCSGCYVAKLSAKARSLPVRVVEATPPQGYNWRLHLVISFFLFALFLVGVVKIIAVAGNLIIFTENPGRWMSKDAKALQASANAAKRLRREMRAKMLNTVVTEGLEKYLAKAIKSGDEKLMSIVVAASKLTGIDWTSSEEAVQRVDAKVDAKTQGKLEVVVKGLGD